MSQPKDVIHILVTTTISADSLTKQKDAHKLRQAAQLWRLEVVEFTIETGPLSARRFLFLMESIFMQCNGIVMELKTEKV